MTTLAIPAMATIVRFTRAGVLNVMNSNFVFAPGRHGPAAPRRHLSTSSAPRSSAP
jgi:ABC-type dipeptide/oligopeptide/nickel transport system permease component